MRFRLTPFLTACFIAVQIVAVAAAGIWFYIAMSDASRDLARASIGSVFAEVTNRTVSYLEPIEQTAVLIGELIESGEVGFDIDPQTGTAAALESTFLDRLRINDQFAGVFVGLPDGSFHYASRGRGERSEAFRTKTISVGDSRDVRYQWYTPDLVPTRWETDPRDTFDPRDRPWYQLAASSAGPIWTDPYIFFTSKKPGITSATAVRDAAGDVVAVVGIDIELDRLSQFLRSTTFSLEGAAFMTGDIGEVFAHSSVATVGEAGSGGDAELRFMVVSELGTAASLLFADGGDEHIAALEPDDPLFERVEIDGNGYLVGLRRMAAANWPWVIGVEVKETSFAAALQRNLWIGVTLMLVLGVAVAVAGFLVARAIGTPLSALRANAQSVVDGETVRLEPVRSRFYEIQDTSVALWEIMERLRKGDDGEQSRDSS